MNKLTEKQVGELQSKISDKLWKNFDAEKSELNNIYLAAPEMFETLELINQWASGFGYKNINLIIEPILKKARGE